MTPKRYSQSNNNYVEDVNGACCGIEWTDSNSNLRRVICVDFPQFDPSLKKVRVVYVKEVKPTGFEDFIQDTSNGGHVIEKVLDETSFRYSDPTHTNFGTPATELGEGVSTEIDFFIDNIFFNVHSLPLRISDFVYQTITSIIQGL